jgi:hypothetical protein
MAKPGNKNRKSEDDLIAAILKVKPTADMPKYPKRPKLSKKK